jgi:hypothetical protein
MIEVLWFNALAWASLLVATVCLSANLLSNTSQFLLMVSGMGVIGNVGMAIYQRDKG